MGIILGLKMDMKSKIRIGNQTAFSASMIMEPFEYAVASGFNAFEWFPDKKETGEGWDVDDMDEETRRYIKDTAGQNDVALSVHAPWPANPLDPKTLGTLSKCTDFAFDIGATILNIHLYNDQGIAAYIKAIKPVINLTKKANIRLTIENTVFTGPEDFNELFRALHDLKDIPTGHVGMCLDIGHANLCASTRNDYLGFVDMLKPQTPVTHVHLHENYGSMDSHLTLFTGHSAKDPSGIADFMERMVKRNFSGSMVLEQWPLPPSLLNNARDRLYRMLARILDTP